MRFIVLTPHDNQVSYMVFSMILSNLVSRLKTCHSILWTLHQLWVVLWAALTFWVNRTVAAAGLGSQCSSALPTSSCPDFFKNVRFRGPGREANWILLGPDMTTNSLGSFYHLVSLSQVQGLQMISRRQDGPDALITALVSTWALKHAYHGGPCTPTVHVHRSKSSREGQEREAKSQLKVCTTSQQQRGGSLKSSH